MGRKKVIRSAGPKLPSVNLPEAPPISDGSIVDAVQVPGKPVVTALGKPSMMDPMSPHAVVNNLVSRDALDPKESLEPLSETVTGLQKLVKAMSKGEDISLYRSHIQRVAANQPEKGDVVRAYVNQANHELLADMIEMRANAVRHIKRAIRRNDISVSESLVVWRMSNDQIPELTKSVADNDKAVDTVTVIEKIDCHRQQIERTVQQKWEGTSPQGREIIRKKLWELERKLDAERNKAVVQEPPEEQEAELVEEQEDTPVEVAVKTA